jgi:hypothetical protein
MKSELVIDTIADYVSNYYGFEYDQAHALALRDSLSSGQLRSKIRAAQTIQDYTPGHQPFRGFFIGHWHGFLPRLLWRAGILDFAAGMELDPVWVDFSNRLNGDWRWCSDQGDINSEPHDLAPYDLVVNTSCEHMDDGWLGLPVTGSYVLAQTTDYQHPTHVNTCQNLAQFRQKFSAYHIIHSCADQYEIYSRYTVLAIKIT